MRSCRPYQWPFIISLVLHVSFVVVGVVVADLLVEAEYSKSSAVSVDAGTTINITMSAVKPVLEAESVHDLEKSSEALLEKKAKSVIDNHHVSEKKIQTVQSDKFLESPSSKSQEKIKELESSNDALAPQEAMMGDQFSKQKVEQKNNAEIQYQDEILGIIESNKFYPNRAKKMRQEGDVYVAFTLYRDGSIQSLHLIDKDAPSLLKKSALKAVQISSLFPPFPSDVIRNTWSFEITLSYRLQ